MGLSIMFLWITATEGGSVWAHLSWTPGTWCVNCPANKTFTMFHTMPSIPHSCWRAFMALCRTGAALQQNYKLEIKRSNVDPDSLFLVPYKSNLERLQIEQKSLVIWHSNTPAELFCYGICSAFHWFLNKVLLGYSNINESITSTFEWVKKKKPRHLRKSLIISTANSFCSMLAYVLIHGKIQGHKFSSSDFLIHKIEPQVGKMMPRSNRRVLPEGSTTDVQLYC